MIAKTHTIEVDSEVYEALKREAEPFVDTTPNTVLRRLLSVDGRAPGDDQAQRVTPTTRRKSRGRPTKKTKKRRSRKRRRAPAGSLMPGQVYFLPILRVLQESGGRAPSREVIERIGDLIGDRLTETDRETLGNGGIRWHNRAQFARLKMVDRGLLKSGSPRGLWEITDEGVAFVSKGGKSER